MLGFGPFCLDMGHIAWIWAIWYDLGQNRPLRRQSPEGEAGGRMDGRTDFPCVLQDLVPFGAAALPLIPIYNHAKQGNGFADHVLPLSDLF